MMKVSAEKIAAPRTDSSLGEWSRTLLAALGLALFVLATLHSAAGQTAGSTPNSGGPKGLLVEVRPPNQPVRLGGPFFASLGDEIFVDVRSVEKFFQDLVDRDILPDPRPGNDAEREADKKDREDAKNLHGSDQTAAIKKIEARGEQRFQNAIDGWLQKMSLFFDGHPIIGLYPESVTRWWPDEYTSDPAAPPTRYDTLQFRLSKTDENRDVWLELLRGNGISDRPTKVTVGFNKVFGDRTDLILSQVSTIGAKNWQRFYIRTAPRSALMASFLAIFALVILCLWLAISSNLLRDTTARRNPSGRYPFSLALCQMAFWLFILVASFLFLWVVTGEYNTMTASELALLGISATTGLAAIFINQITPPCQTSTLSFAELQERDVKVIGETRAAAEKALAEALRALDSKREQLVNAPDPVAAQKEIESATKAADRLKQRVAELKERERYFSPGGRIKQFFLDLLQERNSVDFHRFQMMTWTVILGVVFVFGVFQQLAMPKFDATLLILMGISNGTYLGFKWPTAKSEA
jgi:hypothetical protein